MSDLDKSPARTLTDREVCKIIGGLVGCLSGMTTKFALRTALEFQLKHLDSTYDIATQFQKMAESAGRKVPR